MIPLGLEIEGALGDNHSLQLDNKRVRFFNIRTAATYGAVQFDQGASNRKATSKRKTLAATAVLHKDSHILPDQIPDVLRSVDEM